MEPKKAGAFLQALRKEKGLTQEQLAEHFNVSNRTVSRWETGTNMPDISLLVELADFYSVDIREIIDGERKNENMNEEIKSVATKMADYAEVEKKLLLTRVRIINILGLLTGLASMILRFSMLSEKLLFCKMLEGVLSGLSFGTIICTLLYTTGILEKIRKTEKARNVMKAVGLIGTLLIVMCLIIAAIFSRF